MPLTFSFKAFLKPAGFSIFTVESAGNKAAETSTGARTLKARS